MADDFGNDADDLGAIDLQTFRRIVDGGVTGIISCNDNLEDLYLYVGLENQGAMSRRAVSEALYDRIHSAFKTGHQEVWRICKSLRSDLIREYVLRGEPLDPYFEVLEHLCDAVRSDDTSRTIQGSWGAAVIAARDHVAFQPWGVNNREETCSREFNVARAAKALENAGFEIDLSPGHISMSAAGEARVVEAIETLIKKIGGLNVARRIFTEIEPTYDEEQQRYHLVPQISSTGIGKTQVPWGYLLQLSAKHIEGPRPLDSSDSTWQQLRALSTCFAAVIDVQSYMHSAWKTFNAEELLQFFRELALYDTLFRIPQLRPIDVVRILRGVLDFIDPSAVTAKGWSLDQLLAVISQILDPINSRGPIILRTKIVAKKLPNIPRSTIQTIFDEVLCHPASGANQNFLCPTDAPTNEDPSSGLTFGQRPLLKLGKHYCLIDRAVCAPACIEAALSALRPEHRGLDDDIGKALERFVSSELKTHGVTTMSGEYEHHNGNSREHGECDLIAEVPNTLLFFELKKKALTRRARAGNDVNLLADLAGSLLQAHAQLGWHETRISQSGVLNLDHDGHPTEVKLGDRGIEKFAVSLLDFGSFQDRIVLKHFFEATLNAEFHPHDAALNKKFKKINASLREIRAQVERKYSDQRALTLPFFECWFISMPMLLIMLDGVNDPVGFQKSILACRHITTGTNDLYYEISCHRKQRAAKQRKT